MFIGNKLLQILAPFRKSCSLALTIKEALTLKPVDKNLSIQGWIQSIRKHKNLFFVDVTDGTCGERLQVVITDDSSSPVYGSSIKVEGTLVKSEHKGQEIELVANSWKTIGKCPEDYPFVYRVKYTSEYIRQIAHMRPRTRTFGSTLRVRSCASYAVHKFFQKEGFHLIHTPIITRNDCEGAGEVFSIKVKENPSSECSKGEKADHEKVVAEPVQLMKETDEKNISNEFFNAPAYLTVSGQLHLEALACSLSRVYNFGPIFRAEHSRSRQHASEFHMIEAEIAFIDTLEDLIKIVQQSIQEITKSVMDECEKDINTICEKHTKNHKEYLAKILSKPFVQIPYSEAVSILEKNKESIKAPITWGSDLVAEHKEFLVKYCDNTPVFVCMFPASLKPFYMKTDEREMAYCFDLFAPFGGELCGGSLREDSEDKLKTKLPLTESNSNISWYFDLRKYGSVPHGGFGIGFDRLLQTLLGISNIRDVIPFPRRKYDCQC